MINRRAVIVRDDLVRRAPILFSSSGCPELLRGVVHSGERPVYPQRLKSPLGLTAGRASLFVTPSQVRAGALMPPIGAP